jgi:protein-tyrosine phosphatase
MSNTVVDSLPTTQGTMTAVVGANMPPIIATNVDAITKPVERSQGISVPSSRRFSSHLSVNTDPSAIRTLSTSLPELSGDSSTSTGLDTRLDRQALRRTPPLLATGTRRSRNMKNLSLTVPMSRNYHSAPNSPPATPGAAHPGLLSMMMAKRDEILDDQHDKYGHLSSHTNAVRSPRITGQTPTRQMSLPVLSSLSHDTMLAGRHDPYELMSVVDEDQRERDMRAYDPYQEAPICILPRLYLGTELNAANREVLKRLGIRYILNVAKEVPVPYEDDMLLLSPRSERAAAALKATETVRRQMSTPEPVVPTAPPPAYFIRPKAHPWHGVAAPDPLNMVTPPLYSSSDSSSSSCSQSTSEESRTSQTGSLVVGVDSPRIQPQIDVDTWDRVANSSQSDRFRYKKFNWGHDQEDLIEFFESAFSFIDQGRSSGDSVLVHCQCGVSRSASLVLAYVMRNKRIPLHEAYAYVKARSPVISPNMSLFYQLSEYERKLGLSPTYFTEEPATDEQALEKPMSSRDTVTSEHTGTVTVGTSRRPIQRPSSAAQNVRSLSTVMEDHAESQMSPIYSPRTPREEDTLESTQKLIEQPHVLAK